MFSVFSKSNFLVWSLLISCATFLVGCGSSSVPSSQAETARGLAIANEHWLARKAVIYSRGEITAVDGIRIAFKIDSETGLPFKQQDHNRPQFCNAYNGRIRELIRLHGRPPFSIKDDVPTAQAIADVANSESLPKATQFPVSPSATIEIDFDTALRIRTNYAISTIDFGALPVHILQHESLVYIQYGEK